MAIVVKLKTRQEAGDYTVCGEVTYGYVHVEKRYPAEAEDCAGFDVPETDIGDIRVQVGGSVEAAESLRDAAEIEALMVRLDQREWCQNHDPEYTTFQMNALRVLGLDVRLQAVGMAR